MTDGETAAVLARGLVDPRFARTLLTGAVDRRGVRLSAAQRAVASELDAARLALFAGFITKVRHNSDLFDTLPGTLGLLRQHGVELRVFRDYFLAGRPMAKAKDEKIANAIVEFARFARTRVGRGVIGLADVLAHEEARWQLQRAASAGVAASGDAIALDERAVLIALAPVRAIAVTWDPWAVLDAVARGVTPDPSARRPGTRLHWVDRAAHELRAGEVHRHVGALVAAIDGRRSVAQLGRLLARRHRIAATSVPALAAPLIEAGILRAVAAPRRR